MRSEPSDQNCTSSAQRAGKNPIASLRLSLHRLHTKLKLNRGFSSWALRFWPARRIARRQASELFDLISGFVYTQTLRLAVEVNLLEILKSPTDLSNISTRIGLDEPRTARLLRATTALKLTQTLPMGLHGLGNLGMAVVGNPGLAELIKHHDMLYRDLTHPLELFKSNNHNELTDYWPYAHTLNPEQQDNTKAADVRAYSDLMAASQPMISDQLLRAYPFDKHKSVLDLGGGTGQFLRQLRLQQAGLTLTLFDLPSVCEALNQAELQALRINHQAGDFFHDELPGGADIITLVRITHDHNDNAVRAIFKKAFDALPHNGTLLIAEPLADTPGAQRMGDAYFNLYFMAMGKGEPRSFKRLSALMEEAGFESVTRHQTALPLVCSVISAAAKKLE